MKFFTYTKAIRENAVRHLLELPSDQVYEVEVKPFKRTRSTAQNRLMWAWLTEIKKHIHETTGQIYGSEDLHEYFKSRFLPSSQVNIGGKVYWVPASTTKLSTSEMTDYLTTIEAYCATDLDLILEKPQGLYDDAMGRAT